MSPWLPVETAERPGVRARIEEALTGWADAWFPKSALSVAHYRATPGAARAPIDGSGWIVQGVGVATSGPRRSMTRLVELALDTQFTPGMQSQTDREVLEAFEAALLKDLARRIEDELDPAVQPVPTGAVRDPFAGRGGVTLDLVERSGAVALAVALPFDLLLPHCLASLGPRNGRPARLTPLGRALGATTVALEANLGEVELEMGALNGLACGDVLVLDTRLEAPVRVAAAGGAELTGARLTEVEGSMALVFGA